MNNKASSMIMMIFEVLVVVLVVGMTFYIAVSYAKSETIQKFQYTKDLSLMVNTLVGIPGDSLVEFPHNVSALGFILQDETIRGYVLEEKEMIDAYEVQKIYLPQGHSASGYLEETARICLHKTGKSLRLVECAS